MTAEQEIRAAALAAASRTLGGVRRGMPSDILRLAAIYSRFITDGWKPQ